MLKGSFLLRVCFSIKDLSTFDLNIGFYAKTTPRLNFPGIESSIQVKV